MTLDLTSTTFKGGQRHDELIAYQGRLRAHHIEESDGETIEARELVHMAEDSDDKDEAQALPMAGGPSVDAWMALHRQAIRGCRAIHRWPGPSMDNLDPPLAPNTSEASSNKRYNWICLASASRFHLLAITTSTLSNKQSALYEASTQPRRRR